MAEGSGGRTIVDVSALENELGDELYDEVEIEDMDFDDKTGTFYFDCPCGDRFFITETMIEDGEDIATCPSCTLRIRVIYDPADFESSSDET